MKLSICLVTKGRKEYLLDALNSYEKFIATGEVDVIIIDNGSDVLSKEILYNWKLKHDSKVSYYRVETNEKVGTPFFWEIIRTFSPEWIIFPGDDDVLIFDIYDEWIKALRNNGHLNAFAASSQIIDAQSKLTGEIRVPPVMGVVNQYELIALSLHEPPFLWPCLFFRFSAISNSVFYSRFSFDWGIGLHLVLQGQIESTKLVGIKYRVHGNQESFQASNRRKFFESFNMLTTIINSDVFSQFLKSLTNSELDKFLDLFITNKPLYAQSEYYNGILKDLAFNIIKVAKDNSLKIEIAEKYVLAAGIYTKSDDLDNIYTGLGLPNKGSKGNLALNFSERICENLRSVEKLFNQNSSTKIDVSCKHSKFIRESVIINCKHFNKLVDYEIADIVLLAIDEHFQNKGSLNFIISPFERELIKFYRNLKLKLPNLIKKNLLQMKKFIGDKNAI